MRFGVGPAIFRVRLRDRQVGEPPGLPRQARGRRTKSPQTGREGGGTVPNCWRRDGRPEAAVPNCWRRGRRPGPPYQIAADGAGAGGLPYQGPEVVASLRREPPISSLWLGLAPDGSVMVSYVAGSSEIYALDWDAP